MKRGETPAVSPGGGTRVMELRVPQLCVRWMRVLSAAQISLPGQAEGKEARSEQSPVRQHGAGSGGGFSRSAWLGMQRTEGTAAGLRPPSPIGVTAKPGGDACRSGAASSSSRRLALAKGYSNPEPLEHRSWGGSWVRIVAQRGTRGWQTGVSPSSYQPVGYSVMGVQMLEGF